MKILLYRPSDFEGHKDADIISVAYAATLFDYLWAMWLYMFLVSDEGASFIDRLRETNTSVVLCRAHYPSREFDSMNVVISGAGLVMQYHKGLEVIEDPISCLYACCIWGSGRYPF
jgi:hypothetical protein